MSRTIADAGLHPAAGRETVEVVPLCRDDADLLKVSPSTPFLCCERTTYDVSGQTAGHVTSYLDPRHFRLQLTFGLAQ